MVSKKKLARPIIKWSAVGAVAAFALTGCAAGGNGGQQGGGSGDGAGQTIVFQMNGDPSVVNPTMSTGFADQQVGCVVYEGLTDSDSEGKPLPRLAEDWEISEDGLEYTFHLVEANWQDGEPFTSEDVKFAYENYSSQYGPLWGDAGQVFVGVDTPDEHTAVVKLSAPFAPFLLMTRCSHNGAILPKHIFEGVDPQSQEAKDIDPVGTGPFALTKSEAGQSYTFERNDDYWQEGLPKVDSLVGQVITDTTSAVSALKAGEIDYINDLPASGENQLKGVEGVEIEDAGLGTAVSQLLFFNTKRPPFDNPDVRKALYQALDREYIIEKVWFGRGKPGVSAMTDAIWAYTEEVDYNDLYPFDIDAAAGALDAAGYPADADGHRFSMDLLVRNDPPERVELGNVIKAMWAQVGVDVNVVVMERAAENVAAFQDFDFDANIQGYTNYGDPAAGTARAYTCNSVGRNFGNPSQFCDPALDELWAQASQANDLEERAELYGQIDLAIADQMPALVLIQEGNPYARGSNLQDLRFQNGSPDWSTAYLD